MLKPSLLYYTKLNYDPENLAILDNHFEVINVNSPNDTNIEGILSKIDAACAPLGHYFDESLMDKCPRLKAIISNTTGVSHIDTKAAETRKIEVISLVGEVEFLNNITSTAEHSFGLMLSLLRRIPWSFESVLEGEWNRFNHSSPAMLSRLSLGVVGLGRLGTMMAKYAMAFGMQVKYFDPYIPESENRPPKSDSLISLVKTSDVISLHVPSNKKTYQLIDNEVLKNFPKSSVLINTSRGEVLDEGALIVALERGVIGGAALDVIDGEWSNIYDHPLVEYSRKHDNLIITPHIGGATVESIVGAREFMAGKLASYIQKQTTL